MTRIHPLIHPSIHQGIKQFLLAIVCCFLSLPVFANMFTATVDRAQLGQGETLELTLRYNAQTTSDPDLSVLQQNFEVLSQHQQNQFSIRNGTTVSYTEWRIQLLPRATGSVMIPPITLNGEHSDPISLKVTDRIQGPTSNQLVFIETSLDKTSGYVQEQLILTYRLYSSTNLQSLSSEELMVKDASLMKLSENQYQKLINGVNHLVVELKYALFPESSGKLTIPAIRFNTVIPDRRDPYSNSFFSRGGKRIYLHSEEKTVTINPRPDAFGTGEWLPTKAVSLNQRWSRSLDELVAGEPITRTLYLSAQGLTAAQLPPIELGAADGFKTYPDQPQLKNDVTSDGVMGTRIESIAVVPARGGQITLPAIHVKWWDTTTSQVRETTLPEQTLIVAPAANSTVATETTTDTKSMASTTEGSPSPRASNTLVILLLAGNVILLVMVVFLLFRLKNTHKSSIDSTTTPSGTQEVKETTLFRTLKQCAGKGDAAALREVLLQWAAVFWGQPVVTLDELSVLANSPALSTELKALDKQLYRPSQTQPAQLENIVPILQDIRKRQIDKKADRGNHLQPLYNH